MKSFYRAVGKALLSALINGLLALLVMWLVEFSISGNLHMFRPYVYASLAVVALVFLFQLVRQMRCRRSLLIRSEVRPPGV